MKMSRDLIKFIAIITMTFNHVAHGLMEPGTLLYEVFEDIGYFTAITMCFFLVEGYHYSSDKRKYALRLFLFAVISEFPYVISQGFYEVGFWQPNILFSLLISFGILHLLNTSMNRILRSLLIVVLMLISVICDWSFVLPIMTILFEKTRGDKKREAISYGIAIAIFCAVNFLSFRSAYDMTAALLHAMASGIGMIVSGVVILLFYSGEKSEGHFRLNRWFFYVYYPLHLTVIAILRWNMIGGAG